MRRPHLIAVLVLGSLSATLLLVSLSFLIERPTVLRVAVSSQDVGDFELVGAAAKIAKREGAPIRFKTVPTDGVAQAARALETGDADLAVVRPDVAMPDKGETVVLLHKDVALLVAPGGGPVAKVGDLAGRTVGLLGLHSGDDTVLAATLAQYDIAPDAVKTVALRSEEIGDALAGQRIDAVFGVGQVGSRLLQNAVRVVAKAGEGAPVFLSIEAAAVAERQPAFQASQIVKGGFGGAVPRPAEDVDTLGVTTQLVASTEVSEATGAALTRFLLTERLALAEIAPAARYLTAPATDKSAAIPVHPGTAAYLDDEVETFLDLYSDFIYIGAMVLGVLASGLTAVIGRFGASSAVPIEVFIERLMGVLRQVRAAPEAATLDGCESEVDAIVTEALDQSCLKGLDERKVSALSLAIDHVRAAVGERRAALAGSVRVANGEPAPSGPVLARLEPLGERVAG